MGWDGHNPSTLWSWSESVISLLQNQHGRCPDWKAGLIVLVSLGSAKVESQE